MYKLGRSVASLVLSLAILFCLLSPSQATSPYYNQMLRARPYYVAPQPDNHQPNVESYPVPPHAVSSYAAPLVAIYSADYETTPAAIIPPTTAAIPKNQETDPSSISNNSDENNNDAYNNATEVISLVPEVDVTTTSYDGETTFWLLESSYGDAPYEGTTHAPIYLPTSITSAI
ncbi:hypothetical protein DAPPUDRAFT_244951 [Daphnia pulex]|uniref:Uncharacterized protein n=1 Tax=Daphnia pulex TaxID=6669 RepID=E9GM85_DAPPU|nr:hypothetical protein DAPPUDRAFT_244951 [Daphnia pulex]|eukprot:EFX79319.1 hypothetical protein DAPPUDRAFT_244951 [Daphnia pulex]